MGPIPGEAGTDYPVYNAVPDTGFDCAAQDNPGIYTDTDAGCQVRDMNYGFELIFHSPPVFLHVQPRR